MESHNNWVQYKVYKKTVDMISGMQNNTLAREFRVIMHIFKSNLELIKVIIATINQIESVITLKQQVSTDACCILCNTRIVILMFR